MFVVSAVKNENFNNITKKEINKNSTNFLSSPNKKKEKHFLCNYCFTLQTSNSSYSGKGGSLNEGLQEPIIIENIKENQIKNELLGKKTKTKFQVDYIDTKEKINSSENKELIKEKKEKKKNNSNKLNNMDANGGRWSNDEHIKFMEAIYKYSNNWREVQKYIGTRTPNQVRSHAQKFILKLRTFKDPSLGIDFTEQNYKNLKEIINKIKEIEEKTKKKNILQLINSKLSENNMKNSQNINNKNEKNKKLNNINENNLDKENYNSENENINNNETNNQKEIFKNGKTIDNNEEKKGKTKNENINKESLKDGKEFYYEIEDNNYNLNINYEIINDIMYDINNNYKDYKPIIYNIKDYNTVSIINRRYYS